MAIDNEFLKSIGLDDEALAAKIAEKSAADETGLVAKRDELLGKVTSYKDRLSQYDGVDLDEYSQLKKRMAEIEEKNLMDKGEFEPIRQQLVDQIEETKRVSEEEKGKLRGQLEKMMIDSAAAIAIGKAGGSIKLLMPQIKERATIVDIDGELVLQIKTKDGKPALNDKGEPLKLEELMEELKADEELLGAFSSSGLSGSGSKSNGSGGKGVSDNVFGASRMAAARRS